MFNSDFIAKSFGFFVVAALCIHMYQRNKNVAFFKEELRKGCVISEAVVNELRYGRNPSIHYSYKVDGKWENTKSPIARDEITSEMIGRKVRYIYLPESKRGTLVISKCEYDFYNIPIDSSYFVLDGCPHAP